MTESDLALDNERKEPQDIAIGDGMPGQSWLARIFFGMLECL